MPPQEKEYPEEAQKIKVSKIGKAPAFQFYAKEWKTPRSYTDYCEVPNKSGVYAFVNVEVSPAITHEVLYIGMSNNLAFRTSKHEVLSLINAKYGDVFVYFQEHPTNLRQIERDLIRRYNPRYNLQHRIRGTV